MIITTFLLLALSAHDWTALQSETVKLYNAGQFAEAEAVLRRAAPQMAALDPSNPAVAHYWNNVAAVAHARGRYREAEQAYNKALQWWESHRQTSGNHYPRTLNNFASMLRIQGRLLDAERLCRQAIALSGDAADGALFLFNLAEIQRGLGQMPQAEQTALEGLAMAGEQSILIRAHLHQTIALLSLENGNLSEAESQQQRSIDLFRQALPSRHHLHAVALGNLSQILMTQGRLIEARFPLDRSLQLFREILGPHHPNVATALNNLAQWHSRQGDLAAAEPALREALRIWQQAYGRNHPDVVKGLFNLAAMFQSQGKLRGAETLYRDALRISESVNGPSHSQTAMILANLSRLFDLEQRKSEAARVRERLSLLPSHR